MVSLWEAVYIKNGKKVFVLFYIFRIFAQLNKNMMS